MNENNKLNTKSKTRVLGIYPTYKGFAFAVFEGANNLIDWGNVSVQRQNNSLVLDRIKSFIKYYRPDVIVTEDYAGEGSRRTPRIQSLIELIKKHGKEERLTVKTFSRADISIVFEPFGATNKHEISQVIAKFLPVLERIKPPKRKPWMSEDARMAIFDAAALVITYFYLTE